MPGPSSSRLAVATVGLSLLNSPKPANAVRVARLTDFQGVEEYPAISPDGRSVAFTADEGGTRQIWVRLIAGGPPLQLTRDATDHVRPRWSPDSSSLIYFSSSADNELTERYGERRRLAVLHTGLSTALRMVISATTAPGSLSFDRRTVDWNW